MSGLTLLVLVTDELSEALRDSTDSLSAAIGRSTIVPVDTLDEMIAALDSRAQADVAAVVIDLHCTVPSGVEALFRLDVATRCLPVVVVVPRAEESDGLDAVEAGAQDVLLREESDAKAVIRAIRVARRRWAHESAVIAARRDAEEASRLKDKFVSLVAHDLRGPLGAILGLLEVMGMRKSPPLPEVHRESLDAILKGGRNLMEVVEDILDLSRIQTGKIVPEKGFFDGQYAVELAVERLAMLAAQKNVKIVNGVTRGTRLYADAMLFGQVIQNLVSNAVKFSQAGDEVRIFTPDGMPTVLAVADQGTGIPPDKLPKLFRIEEKVSTPGTAGEQGTGFGLPLSHQIMEALDGSLTVESTVGVGSTFFASLPAVAPKVLVVDDDRLFLWLIGEHLGQIGIVPAFAENGRAALDHVAAQGVPHLILADRDMPVMDGFRLLQELKGSQLTKAVPVIMVTGDQEIETRRRALELGAADFTVKPIVVEDFIPRVQRFVG